MYKKSMERKKLNIRESSQVSSEFQKKAFLLVSIILV